MLDFPFVEIFFIVVEYLLGICTLNSVLSIKSAISADRIGLVICSVDARTH